MAVELSGSQTNQWNETDANNTAAPPDGFAENQLPSNVDDTFRGIFGTVQRFANRVMPKVTLGISSSAAWTYTPVNNAFPTALKPGEFYNFFSPQSNTSPTTININNLGAQSILTQTGSGTATLTGAEIIANLAALGVIDSNLNFQIINPVKRKQPTRTVLTGGSGTYTVPSGATRINVRCVSGGGGGAGSGTSPSTGGSGQVTTFGVINPGTGAGGTINGTLAPGGGVTGNADISIPGGNGGAATSSLTNDPGGAGGNSVFGGGGTAGIPGGGNGSVGKFSSGGGGGGAGDGGTAGAGGGGGAGAYAEALIPGAVITTLAASYAYQVGAGGTGGTAGGSGFAGGNGGTGIIIIDEFYY